VTAMQEIADWPQKLGLSEYAQWLWPTFSSVFGYLVGKRWF
jgi:hypothetical protein